VAPLFHDLLTPVRTQSLPGTGGFIKQPLKVDIGKLPQEKSVHRSLLSALDGRFSFDRYCLSPHTDTEPDEKWSLGSDKFLSSAVSVSVVGSEGPTTR
jgi:hypothetical protein